MAHKILANGRVFIRGFGSVKIAPWEIIARFVNCFTGNRRNDC
jgi:hypothetical protein